MKPPIDAGQRWLRWINLDEFPCPSFGVVNITGSRIDGTEILFEASRMPRPSLGTGNVWELGIPWTAAFNSETTVEPGDTGLLTMDLPTWCLINTGGDTVDDNGNTVSAYASMLKFYSFPGRDSVNWALSQPDSDQLEDNQAYYSGLKVFATRQFPELDAIWLAREPTMTLPAYRIGFVGGLFTGMNS